MLKPVPSVRLLRALRASVENRKLVCSLCRRGRPWKISQSGYSTRVVPTTSINPQKTIPEEYSDLHERLDAFGRIASVYVNIGQLRLTLKNLEVKNSVTRIAVLGVNDRLGPLQLARVLLADPLSPEAAWEKELQRVHKDGKPLLIRPGFKVSLDSSHPLLRTLIIPSKLLEQNKVEILLHQAVLEDERSIHPTKEILSSLLSPSLHAQQSFSGRTTSVIYPVHKTILLENGLGSFLSLAGLLQSKGGKIASRLLHIVSNVNWDVLPGDQHKVFFVNTAKALHAVQAFRENIQNSILYEREWLSSGISSLIPIVLPGISNNATLKPVVCDLIEHILEETELAISTSEAESMQQSLDLTIGEAPRKRFQEDIDIWAEQAHTEFRMGLAILIQSRAWQKLAWWKLLWRVDDIEMITSEAIHQSYLINAQATIMFVAGKLSQAGLLGEDTPSAQSKVDIDSEKRQYSNRFDADTKAPAVTMSNLLPPWPVQIFLSRRSILENTIPPLAACAQRYLLSALSVTGLTSLTSILAYFSVTTTTLYEAGTIAAVGFMFSAYRLQTKWEKARHNWITGVEIEGKRTLDEVEKASREVVETGGRSMMDKTGMTERANARNAISEVRRSLAKLSDGS